jgi:4-amino-4-deoxy-L-arabinose transferase
VDWVAGGGFAAAVAASVAAFFAARSGRNRLAAVLLTVAALALRLPPAAHRWLSPWDERYHAVVAKNLIAQPLVPLLIAEPVTDSAVGDWQRAHVFLHKPPLTLWLGAAAMQLFGVDELSLRLPSVFLSSLAVLVIFALGRRFVSEPAALVAAGFQAWHGRSLLLAGGLRATDHVDAQLAVWVALGALAAVRASDSLRERAPRAWLHVLWVGAATAAAYYAKETPGLVVLAVFAFALVSRGPELRTSVSAWAAALGVALALVLPWQLYVAHAFPVEAAFARGRGARYFLNPIDGHSGPWYFHLANLPSDYGWLAPVALALLFWRAARAQPGLRPLALWLALVYGVFSLAATKMESYVAIADPVIFIALGLLVVELRPSREQPARRALHVLVSVCLAANAAFGVWRAERPFDPRPRNPLWARELRDLGATVDRMPRPKLALYGVPWPTECMFYTRATCIATKPSPAELARAHERGFHVVVYGGSDLRGVSALPYDPETMPARRFLDDLVRAGVERPLVFNARDAGELREYVKRFVRHAEVSPGMPVASPKLARKLAAGASLVVLLPRGQSPPDAVRSQFPAAVFIESETYAQPAG